MKANKELIDYIEKSWDELVVTIPEDVDTHLGLPHHFVAPSVHKNNGFVFREQFYWDTYFTVRALLKAKKVELAAGMVDNLLYLQERLGYIPNSNNKVHLGRSQPPLLSSMVLEVSSHKKNKTWLKKAYGLTVDEYQNVWLGEDRFTNTGLSRYFNQDGSDRGAEDESGWDYTTRFHDRALNYNPIDLNSLLYLYERNLMQMANKLGYEQDSLDWAVKSDNRKKLVNDLMWDKKEKLFFDYDFVNKTKNDIYSLATYLPMFSKLASVEQSRALMKNLNKFETPHGLTTTLKTDSKIDGKQWSGPNAWAPLQLFVVEGLANYGYQKQAKQIAQKWVKTVEDKFKETGKIYEKYNAVDPHEEPAHAVYPDQAGFAWTNAVTYLLIKEY